MRPSNFVVALLAVPAMAAEPLTWAEASQKAHDFVTKLTTNEKIGLVSGGYSQPGLPCVGSIGLIRRFEFEGVCFSDGPAGYSRSDGVSVFASGITAAASWDRELIYERAVAIGEEFRAKGAHVHLGPSAGPLGRHARGGRNWESFGPDPYLAGAAMQASVLGIQSNGVQACSKHYIGNEQETQRTSTVSGDGSVIQAISSNIDDRTLHELYLWPFANAVKAGTSAIMCSYNRVNSKYACGSKEMLSILTKELGFQGYVVSDWFATHATDFAQAGLDLEMPGSAGAEAGPFYFGEHLLHAVNNGSVPLSRIEEMAERVLTPYFRLHQNEAYHPVDPSSGAAFMVYQYGHNANLQLSFPHVPARDVRGDHAKLIRKLGAAATVLLKNVNNTLPLKDQSDVGVFGNGAPYPTTGSVYLNYGEHPEGFKMGTVDIGGGSGTVRHTHLVTPLNAIRERVEASGGRVQVLLDNEELLDGRLRTIYPVPQVCLLFLKAYATEGQDRKHIDLEWDAATVVENTAAVCPNTVVVLHGPGVVLMPWAENENVTAIISAHYPGEEIGNSIVDVLWGLTEPSGRLPYTVPRNEADYGPPIVNLTQPVTDEDAWHSDFDEGQMIDYRHFDAQDIEPLFEFGFGLSFTEFDMGREISVDIEPALPGAADEGNGIGPGGLTDLWAPVANATIVITNTGSSTGSAVPQLYLSFPKNTTPEGTPPRVLRGFEKVPLEPGESRKVRFELLRRDVSFWDESARHWWIPEGEFTFSSGFSSRDLRANLDVRVRV